MKAIAAGLALLLASAAAAQQVSAPIDPAYMMQVDKVLASDAFQGRAPGTPGEDRTIAYLVDAFTRLGLKPAGPGGSFVQQVTLEHTRTGQGTITIGGRAMTQGRDVYVSTVRPVDRVRITNAPLVFVGYGVAAPERGWDDFKGVDLHGKIAVFLVNDPDFAAQPGDDAFGRFGGKRMTYYGRWTYKYEEAARRGAIGALIVHDTPGAGYGWSTVTAPGGENYDLADAPPGSRVLLQGWIEGAAAATLFAAAGQDIDKLRAAARRSDFRSVLLAGQNLTVDLPVTHEQVKSRNVLAMLPGATHPDEAVMYGAHWDAYGIGKPDAQGRTIRPGANDDGLGVAAVLATARAYAAAPRTARTILFGIWTAEERGLLGSEAWATAPTFPPAKIAADITFDILNTGGQSHDVMLVGAGQDSLEDDLTRAAQAQGRTVTPEALPERGLFYRADHFSLAKRGVPTLLFMAISGAPDLVAGGRAAGQAWLDGYMKCYHQTCDAFDPAWDLRGAAQDVALGYAVGRGIAESRDWPTWKAGSEFAAIRTESAAARR